MYLVKACQRQIFWSCGVGRLRECEVGPARKLFVDLHLAGLCEGSNATLKFHHQARPLCAAILSSLNTPCNDPKLRRQHEYRNMVQLSD